jgi:hypothetical protein
LVLDGQVFATNKHRYWPASPGAVDEQQLFAIQHYPK